MGTSRERPETLGQARHWENVKNKYLQVGLCPVCAAQAAWGHQNGFTSIHPPCDNCQEIVETLTINKAGPWKAIDTKKRRADPPS